VTERQAFLAAICAQPDEDMPRLAFADWLDEHGEHDRAEFVRVQVALAALPGCRHKPTPQELQFADGTVQYMDMPDCGRCERCERLVALRARERELWARARAVLGLPDPS
jgi:uncharacterized protein (TIGR02996 family)